MKKHVSLASLVAVILSFVLTSEGGAAESHADVVLKSEIQWTPLNAARGDKSPKAGKLWGDRTAKDAAGFLVEFKDGFSSPPHIHNATYRGVVISGSIHNDDPNAENMWLSKGSFWTQPAGEAHITSASGDNNIAYIEIESGPYLVQPFNEAFDNGERPVNIDASNLVWLNAPDVTWLKQARGVQMAFLWGSPDNDGLSGSFIKLDKGFNGHIKHDTTELRAIVIQGQLHHQESLLPAGSYFGSTEPSMHRIVSREDTILYVRSKGAFDVLQDK